MIFITRIPTHYNDGTKVEEATIHAIVTLVSSRFGGFTLDGPGRGGWLDNDGTMYDEPSYQLIVKAESTDYQLARDTVVEIGRMLNQLAMWFEIRYMDGVEIIEL